VGFVVGFALVTGLSALAVRLLHSEIWMPISLAVGFSLLVSLMPWLKTVFKLSFSAAAGSGILLFWLQSVYNESLEPQRQGLAIAAGALLLCLIVVVVVLKPADRKAGAWLLPAMLMAWAIAYFSGSKGASIHWPWLPEEFHFAARKLGHFLFYGLLAFFPMRSALAVRHSGFNAAIFALLLSMAVAVFDESRQSMAPNRYGTFRDIIIDLMGACTSIAITLASKSRRGR
jgi:VanZ family protein